MKYSSLLVLLLTFFTFGNFTCEKDEIVTTCEEKPKADCICTAQYDPVCGCNGKTYGNACSAECAGITDYTKGECQAIKNNLNSEWFFMGYLLEDKITISNPTKAHNYNVNIIFKEETSTTGEKKSSINGQSSVNFYGGTVTYKVNSTNAAKGNLSINNFVMTKIAGSPEANLFEMSYVERLGNAESYEFLTDKVLKINVSTPKGESMIFTRK